MKFSPRLIASLKEKPICSCIKNVQSKIAKIQFQFTLALESMLQFFGTLSMHEPEPAISLLNRQLATQFYIQNNTCICTNIHTYIHTYKRSNSCFHTHTHLKRDICTSLSISTDFILFQKLVHNLCESV